jgi:hypothetical protein
VARIDRPDWVQVLAKDMKRSVADFYMVDRPHTVSSNWADHYRRCLSKDVLTLEPRQIALLVPGSNHDTVGFIDDNGEEKRQIGVVCMLHGVFRDAVRCPRCIAPDMLLTALGRVIGDIREGAEFDERWEAVEEAFDLLTKEAGRVNQPPDVLAKDAETVGGSDAEAS